MDLAPPHALATFATVMLALAGPSCESTSTLCDAVNGEVILSARVDDTDTNTRFELIFNRAEGAGISRSFCSDDTVTVNGEEATKIRRPSGNTVFALNLTAPALTYTIVITHDGTPTELVATPTAGALSLTAPAAGDELSRAEPVTIAWEPALGEPEEMTVIVGDTIGGISCFAALFTVDTLDLGTFDLNAGALDVSQENLTCEAFVELIRLDSVPFELRDGAAFHPDSRMVAATERSIEFDSTP